MPIDQITIINAFPLAYKLSVKEPPPSDWLALASRHWIASVEKTLDGDAVLIISTNGAKQSKKLK
jgi:hypothetical protein